MSYELALCLITLFGLAGIGTPIGYAIMLASLVYLGGIAFAVFVATSICEPHGEDRKTACRESLRKHLLLFLPDSTDGAILHDSSQGSGFSASTSRSKSPLSATPRPW